MKKSLLGFAAVLAAVPAAFAQHSAPASIYRTTLSAPVDSGWVVGFPTGSSDFFNVSFDVVPGIGNFNANTIPDGYPLAGLGVSVTDFGSGRTYATVGIFNSNLGTDPSGQTPDLSNPIKSVSSPTLSPPALFQFVVFDFGGEGTVPSGSTRAHTVVQLPPGDSGLLGVGADSTGTARRAAV